ncbi:hypothetical protein IH979_03000 [Patescibacteria group bacterium]|nr:hypothetical protein [Patescibacteria group bacterium]
MSTCIFPGKFQPFHNGQLLVVKGMFKACGRVVVAICHDGNEMFTTDKVREMISSALLGSDIVDANIIDVRDCPSDEEWVDKILEAAERPAEPIFWSGDETVLKIFENLKIKTQKVAPVPGISGQEIRQMIQNGNAAWKDKVPKEVAEVIEKHPQ